VGQRQDATKKADVPKEGAFETKPQIALKQIRQAITDGVPKGIALADAGYGTTRPSATR
jgi:SRSO17 transposase